LDDILPDTGVCALVKEQQVAIFRSRRLNELFAVGNYDPIGEANVLSRGVPWLAVLMGFANRISGYCPEVYGC